MISSFGSTSIGFALSGLLATAFNIEWAFYLDALTFLFSAACLLFVKVGKIEAEGDTSVAVVVANLKEGISTLVRTPMLRSLFVSGAPVYLSFGMWNVLLLPFAIKALGATEFEYGLQEGVTSVGFVIGSLMMAKWAERFREGSWIVVSTVAMGVAGILYGYSTSILFAIVLVTISGFFNAPSSIARRVLLQRATPRELRGRVFSAFAVAPRRPVPRGHRPSPVWPTSSTSGSSSSSRRSSSSSRVWGPDSCPASAGRRPSGGGRCRRCAARPRRPQRPSPPGPRPSPTSTGSRATCRPSPA